MDFFAHLSSPNALSLSGPKMFCASPNFLSPTKHLTAFSASSKTFVPAQKTILLKANHLFVWHKTLVLDLGDLIRVLWEK